MGGPWVPWFPGFLVPLGPQVYGSPGSLGSASSYSQDLLADAARRQHLGLSGDDRRQLTASLGKYGHLFGETMYIGTFFSGCELFMHCLDVITDIWRGITGNARFKVIHEFSVEVDDWKRDFVTDCGFKPKHQFCDAVKLMKNGWRGCCQRTRKTMLLPQVDGGAAGFECDSVSALNIKAMANKECVPKSDGKTGRTCEAILEFMTWCRSLLWFFLENVKTLGTKNLTHIITVLNLAGFYVISPMLSSEDYGAPCRRTRQWMFAIQVVRCHCMEGKNQQEVFLFVP